MDTVVPCDQYGDHTNHRVDDGLMDDEDVHGLASDLGATQQHKYSEEIARQTKRCRKDVQVTKIHLL